MEESSGIYFLWVDHHWRDDLIIITSSLGSLLSGGVNAQRVQALLGDMERFVVL